MNAPCNLSSFTPSPTNAMLVSISRPQVVPFKFSVHQPLANHPPSLSLSQSSRFCRRNTVVGCLISPSAWTTSPNHTSPNNKIENGFLEMDMKVRDYELDQYGVVNNAVYSNYCQQAHFETLESIGLDFNAVESSGGTLALSKISHTFLAPLKSGEKFVVKVRISDFSTARLYFEHFIYKLPLQQPILQAKAVMVFLDKNQRPTRIPTDLKLKLKQLLNHDHEARSNN